MYNIKKGKQEKIVFDFVHFFLSDGIFIWFLKNQKKILDKLVPRQEYR